MKIKAYATMYIHLFGEFEAPDGLEPDELYEWVRTNVDGGDFQETGKYDWEYDYDIEILEETDNV